jgi:MYXO-CTERM domain-containing protein
VPAQAARTIVQAQSNQTNQAALGRRGFGRRAPSFGSRSRYPSRYRARPHRRPGLGVGHFFGGVLKLLGLAYLFNLLFGWGPGGSPFGLILLFGLIVLFATRRRRRPAYY